MILLNRLEAFAKQRGFFSEMQFGFQEGVGCIRASFVILETINHMLEPGSKVFSCFLDVRKALVFSCFLDGLLYKLFPELEVGGRMCLAIKDLYTGVNAQVLYPGSLSRQFSVSQRYRSGENTCPLYVQGIFQCTVDRLIESCLFA